MFDFWGVGYEVAKRMGIEDRIHEAGYETSMCPLRRHRR